MTDKKAEQYIRTSILCIILAAIAGVFIYDKYGGNVAFGLTGQAENALRKEIESESQGNIQLADFRKTDGQTSEAFGVKSYSLQFEGEITFSSDGYWLTHNPMAGQSLTFSFSKAPVAFGGMNGATQVHTGSQVKIAGSMEGQKSENGWNFGIDECHIVSQ